MGVDVGLIPSLAEALHFPQTQTLYHATPMTCLSPRKTYHTNFVGKPIKNNKPWHSQASHPIQFYLST